MGLDPVAGILEQIERGELADPLAVLAYLAGENVDFPDEELNAARRRAMLLLASGGDVQREIGADDRSVKALAADLETDERLEQLAAGLDDLVRRARELPHVREALIALAGDLELAWRLLALALVAEGLGMDEG